MFMKNWNEVTTWYAPSFIYLVGFHYKLSRVKIL